MKLIKSHKELRIYRNYMQSHPTKHEKIFKDFLIENKEPYKNQMIFGFYIADFILPKRMLMVEIDGNMHDKQYDLKRDAFAINCGYFVLRIKNECINIDKQKALHFPVLKNYKELFKSALGKANALRGTLMHKYELYIN